MAKYTMELRELLALGFHPALDDYPIFDEGYRPILNQKILDHYMFREIGLETPDKFNFFLGRKMREIMPYYNKVYESELIRFDPLATDFTRESRQTDRAHEEKNDTLGQVKEAQTTGDVYSGYEDRKNVANASGTADELTHGETTANAIGTATTAKDGTGTKDTTQNTTDDTVNHGTTTSATTNNLTTATDTENDGSGTNDTHGVKSSVFSDMPQSSVTVNVSMGSSGSGTASVDGYATTATTENTAQHDDTTTHQTSNSVTKNTGTVDVAGSADSTTKSTGNQTGNEKTSWTENDKTNTTDDQTGTSDTTANRKTTETSDDYTVTNASNERNIANNRDLDTAQFQERKRLENEAETVELKGRRGISPSQLIQQYRDSLVNVDMLVIRELSSLFMEVF